LANGCSRRASRAGSLGQKQSTAKVSFRRERNFSPGGLSEVSMEVNHATVHIAAMTDATKTRPEICSALAREPPSHRSPALRLESRQGPRRTRTSRRSPADELAEAIAVAGYLPNVVREFLKTRFL
jgi:hypothetical protein